MGVRKAQHPVRDPASELAVLRVDVAGVQLRIVPRETRKSHEVGIGDGAAGTAECHSYMKVGIPVAGPSFVDHGLRLILDAAVEMTSVRQDLQARISDSGGRYAFV